MAAESYHIPFHSSSIHYTRMGNGDEWLFCFHGYGESSKAFDLLENVLFKRFTIIAIDLPFHGKTKWEEGLLFEPADLVTIINLIKPKNASMCILGYSMGGRIALQLLEMIPEQISKLVLVAPDGLHKNRWRLLATRTKIGKRLFAFCMRKPFLMIASIELADKIGLYNKSFLKFVHHYLDDAEQRAILFRRWTTLRNFKTDLTATKKIIINRKIPVHLVFGKYDRVILSRHGLRFSKGSNGLISVTVVEAGHQLLREKHLPVIVRGLVE